GAWGVVPAHLNELSPPGFRGTFPGLTYQLGNLIAASSSQIEAILGEKFPKDGVPNYGMTQALFVACALVLLIFFVAIGKEAKGINFVEEHDEEKAKGVDPTGKMQMGEETNGAVDSTKEINVEEEFDPSGEMHVEKAKGVDITEKKHIDV
ncbi:935_t:CDS:1, partial [Acaulospora colombiana]